MNCCSGVCECTRVADNACTKACRREVRIRTYANAYLQVRRKLEQSRRRRDADIIEVRSLLLDLVLQSGLATVPPGHFSDKMSVVKISPQRRL